MEKSYHSATFTRRALYYQIHWPIQLGKNNWFLKIGLYYVKVVSTVIIAILNRPMDLVVQSTSSEGGAVIAFLHFYRIVSTMFQKIKFQVL